MIDMLASPPPALFAALAVATALIADALIGDPPWLWRRVGHPVVWIGGAISAGERWLNRPRWPAARRRAAGLALALALIGGGATIGVGLSWLCVQAPFGWLLLGLIASPFLAQRSLITHVEAVRAPLAAGDLPASRSALSLIVGRETAGLDETGVAGAAIESLAENASDGVTAPLFWFALAGPAGLIAYKALNTADSMIGHRDARYADFGWAAARLDDLANLAPARLSALLIALGALWAPGASPKRALAAAWRDARAHRSPNAGWPEAACAGALGLAIGGPRHYAGVAVEGAVMGAGGRPPSANDLNAAMRMMTRATPTLWLIGIAAAASLW